MVSMAHSFAAQPQLLIFLLLFELWLILSRPFTPCKLGDRCPPAKGQHMTLMTWCVFPVEFCGLRKNPEPPWPSQSSRTDACHPPRTRQVKNTSTSMSIAVVTATVIKGVCQSAFFTLYRRGVSPKPWKLWYLAGLFATTNVIQWKSMHRNIPSKAYQLVECIEQQLEKIKMHDWGFEGNSRTPKSETPNSPTPFNTLQKVKLGALEVLQCFSNCKQNEHYFDDLILNSDWYFDTYDIKILIYKQTTRLVEFVPVYLCFFQTKSLYHTFQYLFSIWGGICS